MGYKFMQNISLKFTVYKPIILIKTVIMWEIFRNYSTIIRKNVVIILTNLFSGLHNLFWGINPVCATGLFLYSLETSENLWFSDVLREGLKKDELTGNMAVKTKKKTIIKCLNKSWLIIVIAIKE